MATQDDINNFNANNTVEELLSLSSLVYSNTENRSSFVATVNDLPDLNANTIAQGTVFYVESLGVPVIAQIGCWTGIDNRELRNDFNLAFTYAWGSAACGRLGDASTVSKSSPVSVVGGFTDWCHVSAGCLHSLGVRKNGTAWAWGSGICGILGDSTIVSKSSPVSVVGGFTDWCQLSAGTCHSLGVKQDGTAWAWGLGTCGRLGDNTVVAKSSPVSVVGGFTDWCQVSAGLGYHSLGVRQNGTAWGWGCNGSGRLGNNATADRSSPVSVVGGFTDWSQVSAGNAHSLGVRQNGSAWAWGLGTSGQLGDNTAVAKSSPVSVVGGFTNWCQVSAGSIHSLGVRTNGSLWAWGSNLTGRLGDGTAVSRSSPVSVVGGFTDWCQVSAGGAHTIGIRTNGAAWAWGSNGSGRLGDDTTTDRSSPVSVVGNFTNWSEVSAGNDHSLGIISA
jgi:alpha-tubulin suppressor-like RCC1 family protein